MSYLKQAVKLVQEGDRHTGHGRFFADFIDDWSYRQTGVYAPSTTLCDPLKKLAHQLSHITRSAWEESPGDDFLGSVIEECGGSGHLSFFRTPPAISSLMTQFMRQKTGLTDFCDVCMGSGSLTLAHIHQTFLKGGAKAVARLNITGQDLSVNKVKVSMLQIVNLLDILGDGKPLYVHSLKLHVINSLSREYYGITYDFSGVNNKNCQLDEKQKRLLHEAIMSNASIKSISEQLRIPINLIKKEMNKPLNLINLT